MAAAVLFGGAIAGAAEEQQPPAPAEADSAMSGGWGDHRLQPADHVPPPARLRIRPWRLPSEKGSSNNGPSEGAIDQAPSEPKAAKPPLSTP